MVKGFYGLANVQRFIWMYGLIVNTPNSSYEEESLLFPTSNRLNRKDHSMQYCYKDLKIFSTGRPGKAEDLLAFLALLSLAHLTDPL